MLYGMKAEEALKMQSNQKRNSKNGIKNKLYYLLKEE